MTNGEKYKTPEERTKAFMKFCCSYGCCTDCPLKNDPKLIELSTAPFSYCEIVWLKLGTEEEKVEKHD